MNTIVDTVERWGCLAPPRTITSWHSIGRSRCENLVRSAAFFFLSSFLLERLVRSEVNFSRETTFHMSLSSASPSTKQASSRVRTTGTCLLRGVLQHTNVTEDTDQITSEMVLRHHIKREVNHIFPSFSNQNTKVNLVPELNKVQGRTWDVKHGKLVWTDVFVYNFDRDWVRWWVRQLFTLRFELRRLRLGWIACRMWMCVLPEQYRF